MRDVLHPTQVELDVRTADLKRVQVLPLAPRHEGAEVRIGVSTRLPLELFVVSMSYLAVSRFAAGLFVGLASLAFIVLLAAVWTTPLPELISRACCADRP